MRRKRDDGVSLEEPKKKKKTVRRGLYRNTAVCHDFNRVRRTGNDSRLIMDYTLFNMTDSQDLVMKAGETIHAELVVKSGTLSVQIQTENGEVVYEDSDIKTSGSFNVAVKENGIYTVTVTGKMAEGSVSFQKAVG